jgi:hypothetical protein
VSSLLLERLPEQIGPRRPGACRGGEGAACDGAQHYFDVADTKMASAVQDLTDMDGPPRCWVYYRLIGSTRCFPA